MSAVQKKTEVYSSYNQSNQSRETAAMNGGQMMPTTLTRQQNAEYREKVLVRKRKRSRHPLRDLRVKAGFTLEELAHTTQLSPSYLSRLESGSRRLNADIMQRLSAALECNPGDLVPPTSPYVVNQNAQEPSVSGHAVVGRGDLPVYTIDGSAQGGSIQPDTVSDWMTRPSELVGVIGAFACVLNHAHFGPRYGHGDRILLHPTAPLSQNCSVLLVTNDNAAVIGRFVGWEGTSSNMIPHRLIVETLHSNDPSAKVQHTYDRDQLKGTYRIIGSFEAV